METINPLKQYLLDNERPASWLARKTGLAVSTVINHVEGLQMPSLAAVKAYHKITGIALNDLAMAWPCKNAIITDSDAEED